VHGRSRLAFVSVVGLLLVVQIGLGALPAAQAQQPPHDKWVDQEYVPGPPDNPLKGLMPYRGSYTKFPYSMEWSYVAWRDIQTSKESFNWEVLDGLLQDVASRGHHAVFRIYADYPDTPYAVPDFLRSVRKHPYKDFANGAHATSYSPDYDDARMVDAMTRTIQALGARYDGDPRIGFITVGFIGFWGEWHTYRRSCRCSDWMPSAETQATILNTFVRAFTKTRLLVRYPVAGWSGRTIGFHDDSFAHDTVDPPEWRFVGRLKAAKAMDRWQSQPIGGELYPKDQPCTFRKKPCNPRGQNFGRSVKATHASWMLANYAFTTGYTGGDYARALAGARQLGYDFFVSGVRIRDAAAGEGVSVEIRMQNRGVAPFYYDWTVQLGIADASKNIVATLALPWRLRDVMAGGEDVRFEHELSTRVLPAGSYTIVMRAMNPLVGGKPLVFANAKWGQDVPDWLTLGTIEVTAR